MQESRLLRSHAAHMRNRKDVQDFCDANNVKFSVDFNEKTQPTEEMKREFTEAFALPALPPSSLTQKGASTVLVFETKYGDFQHGEMVAAVADLSGKSLEPGVETIYLHASINPAYRRDFQPALVKPINELLENQGVPVLHTSIGWEDRTLTFQKGLDEQNDALWKITAFVVDSAGNDGLCGSHGTLERIFQKHNAISHAPPLVVHVGAAARDEHGKWNVEGYSSANSPTLLAPVAPNKKALWDPKKAPEALTGTSLAAPYVSGALAALNCRYGSYLTREQILYGVLATCEKVDTVKAYIPKTPQDKELAYTKNAAGLSYNPEYAGFGMIQPHKADQLLAKIVELTQAKPTSISVPVEERVRFDIPYDQQSHKGKDGKYVYDIKMPPGIALKTTVDLEFTKYLEIGKVELVSPKGTRLPLVMSESWNGEPVGISTTHGFAGEPLEGVWRVESTQPLRRVQMNQHHFMSNDIVGSLNVPALLKAAKPALADAKTLTELATEHQLWRRQRSVESRGLTVGGAAPQLETTDQIIAQLSTLPSALGSARTRIYTPATYDIDQSTYAGQQEYAGHLAEPIQTRIDHFKHAATAYGVDGKPFEQSVMLYSAADQLMRFIPPYIDNNAVPAQEAAKLAKQAMKLNIQGGRADLAYADCCLAYSAECKVFEHYSGMGDAKRAGSAETSMKSLRGDALKLRNTYFGGIDPQAHRVEEGEMGFSDKQRMGTDNVSQCLAIIARDPVTKKTGLAHLDNEINVKSLDAFFGNFSHNRLDLKLIGAFPTLSEHSRQNITNVMRYLADKNVTIIAADTQLGINGPTAVTVDPATFAVAEKVPGHITPNAAIANAVLAFTQQAKPLEMQFDLTKGTERSPIFLNKGGLDYIRKNFIGKSEAALERHFTQEEYQDRPVVVDYTLDLIKAYEQEWGALSKTLELTLASQHADAQNAGRARAALAKQRFFVGEHAAEANEPIHTWIKDALLVNGEVQFAALNGIRLDEKAHRLAKSNVQPQGHIPFGF